MEVARKATKRALREAQREASRASGDTAAWRALALRAKAADDRDEQVRAWTRLAHLQAEGGAYLASLRSLARARALGADVARLRTGVWRQLGLASGSVVLSAALMAAAVPPLDLWPLGLVAVAPLYIFVRTMAPAQALAYGWVTGLLINLHGFGWGLTVMERFGHVDSLPAMGALLVLCAYQGVVFGIWTGVSALLARRARVPWLVVAPLVMALAEAVLPFLFPWSFGVMVWRAWPLLQVAELGGPGAVSALIVLVNLTLAEVWLARSRREAIGRPARVAAVVILGIVGLGLVRAGHVAWLRARAPHLQVGVLQPNFGIVSADDRKLHGQEYINLLRTKTDELGQRGAQLVVWPESAFPFLFDRQLEREFAGSNPWALRGSYRGTLLLGALTHQFGGADVYNSAVLVAPDGRIAGRYDKVRLMAFGEYVPLADRFPEWAGRVRKRMPDSSDIVPGKGAAVLESGPLRVAPMICYEDILPETGQDIADLDPRPNLLVTLANHTWFGDSLAPRLALALATLRSVELRRDLVRATSTGVSSIGDALGRVHVEGPLLDPPRDRAPKPALLDGDVALMEGFSLAPWGPPVFPYACALALAVVASKRRGSK